MLVPAPLLLCYPCSCLLASVAGEPGFTRGHFFFSDRSLRFLTHHTARLSQVGISPAVAQERPPRGKIGRCILGREAQLQCPGVQGDFQLAHRWLYEALGGLSPDVLNATWEPRSTVTGERCRGIGDTLRQQYNHLMRYDEELAVFRMLVRCNAPLVYVRMNDGERDALRGQHNRDARKMDLGASNQKASASQIREDILYTINHTAPNFWIGFPVPRCLEGLTKLSQTGGGSPGWVGNFVKYKRDDGTPVLPPLVRWTYSNFFSHAAGRGIMRTFVERLLLRENTFVITVIPLARKLEAKFKKAPVVANSQMLRVSPRLSMSWTGKTRQTILDQCIDLARPGGRVFLFALGAPANAMASYMFEASPQNTYIDIGSILDLILGISRRGWHHDKCQKLGARCTEARWSHHPNLSAYNGIANHVFGRRIYKHRHC
mmetsp:Transcript_19527/g.46641  ORF Transcript_19527/g.46641 Transcript_19527/m.46641 type:complete len:432 (+) Transcript_19527:256-1551(+)